MPIAFVVRTLKALFQFKVGKRELTIRDVLVSARRCGLELTVDERKINRACCDAIRFRGGPMSHNAIALNKRGFSATHSIVSRAPLPLLRQSRNRRAETRRLAA